MKKFLAILVVLAITGFGVMAFAADVTVGGSIEVRSRDFHNLTAAPDSAPGGPTNTGTVVDTQERVRIDVNAKTDNVKGKLQLEQDYATWGQGVETYSNGTNNGTLGFREAWINFNLPGVPVNVNVGHQLLQLGNGYFFRSQHFGSDAWVVANVTGNNTAAFVDVKAFEFAAGSNDDVDAYVFLDVFKLAEKTAVGIDITRVDDRRAALAPGAKDVNLYNVGLNFSTVAGPLNLKAQLDLQAGKIKANAGGTDSKFKGNDIVVKGDMAAGAATVNFTAARGTGNKAGDVDQKQFVTIVDIDPHYTFLYEYKVRTAALNYLTGSNLHTGFANTTALNIGGGMDVSKSVNINAQLWYLKATEKVAINGNPTTSDKLGYELDVKATWKLYDNLTWTWDLGYFKPGEAYKSAGGQDADAVTGIQGILAFKF